MKKLIYIKICIIFIKYYSTKMNAQKISENIALKSKNYIDHKVKIIEERVYWACIDKIYEAEHYDEYEMDNDNNIYVVYSLKKDESIILHTHDIINTQIINKYRQNVKLKLTKDNFYINYDDDDNIKIYFIKPMINTMYNDSDSDSDVNENIIIYKDKNKIMDNVEFGIVNNSNEN